jgi:hypothetical protein
MAAQIFRALLLYFCLYLNTIAYMIVLLTVLLPPWVLWRAVASWIRTDNGLLYAISRIGCEIVRNESVPKGSPIVAINRRRRPTRSSACFAILLPRCPPWPDGRRGSCATGSPPSFPRARAEHPMRRHRLSLGPAWRPVPADRAQRRPPLAARNQPPFTPPRPT